MFQNISENDLMPTFSVLANAFPEPVYVRNVAGKIVFRNEAMLLFGDDNIDADNDTVALVDRKQLTFDKAVVSQSGAVRRYKSFKAPITDENNQIIGLLGIFYDITDIALAREAYEETNGKFERFFRAKSQFMAAINHDIRQPLQAAQFYLDNIGAFISQEGQETYDKLKRCLTLLTGMFDNLVAITRLESGFISPQIEDFVVDEITNSVCQDFTFKASAKGIVLQVVSSGVMIRSDRDLLRKILHHLVDNAVKYTERGRVLIDIIPRGETVVIEVRDSGVGIPQSQIENIWDLFYQVGNAKRERERGQGIGLAIVRRLANLLKHDVRVVSSPDAGSTFSIHVPKSISTIREDAAVIAKAEAARVPRMMAIGDEPERKPSILIIDDDPLIREAIGDIFAGWPEWKTVLAESADAAMEIVKQPPDLLIMDYRLGSETGDVATQRLREFYGMNIPAFMLTGDVGDEVRERARACKMSLIHKPIDTVLLREMIITHLDSNEKRGAAGRGMTPAATAIAV